MTTADHGIADAIDEARLWQRLMRMAEIGATANGGVDRPALSACDNESRRLMLAWAAELGLEASIDEMANLYLRRPGTDPSAAPVLTGSHLDSQPTGGKFDGAYGVIAAFEALEAIERAGLETRRAIEVVSWTNEEGSRFQPGCLGSAVFAGKLRLEDLDDIRDAAGTSATTALAETLAGLGDLDRRAGGFPVAAYLEVHIEQGPRLEAAGDTIGVVTGIQGSRRFGVEVRGVEAHAGTEPMASRKDALKTACRIVGALEEVTADPADRVRFTVGRFEVFPGSPNTVPGRVFFTLDLRHPEQAVIDRLTTEIETAVAANTGVCEASLVVRASAAPVHFDAGLQAMIGQQADALGLGQMALPSFAGHDAGPLSAVCPAGLIFVPCAGGVSHNEAESATPEDLAAGTRVLANCLVELAR
ncbi:MAG: M20 family metallo-hydrolase [Alphaproteobacteria bacterium]|nr:M20 family metallo-hydrolase [Alphaproteobacteria bacterium]